MSKLEYLDYDLNNLFSLNYNFETLKLMLESLGKNQVMFNKRLNDLESKGKRSSIDYINNKETAHNNNNNTITSESKSNNTPRDNIITSSPKKKHEPRPSVIENADEEDNISQTDYNMRIKILETKINKLYSLLSTSSTQKELSNLEQDIQSKINVLYDKHSDVNNKLSTIESALEDLKIKVSDFNIYELLKDNINAGEGSVDTSKILIQTLENKIFKKFNLVDEKIKLNEKELYKAKTDLVALKNNNDSFNRSIPMMRADISEAKSSIEALSNSTDEKVIELQNIINNISKQFTDRINSINDEIKVINEANDLDLKETDINKEINPIPSISGLVTDKEYRKFKEGIMKRLNEIERKHTVLNERCDFDPIYSVIQGIKEELSDKANHQQVYNVNDRVVSFGDGLNSVRDDQVHIIEDIKKFKADQNQIFKKIEAIQSQVLVQKIGDNTDRQKSKENSILELSRYLEIRAFNDFLKMYQKDNERMKRDNEDLKRNNEEMNELLKTKATEMQLNQLEDYLISLTEEMKNSFNKKYADRIDTNKNFKSIESQIKHIIEIYIKRSDKGDNWLIAKKPIGGYSCASCENYIGELTDKTEYLTWNKVPGKEALDRTYRVNIII